MTSLVAIEIWKSPHSKCSVTINNYKHTPIAACKHSFLLQIFDISTKQRNARVLWKQLNHTLQPCWFCVKCLVFMLGWVVLWRHPKNAIFSPSLYTIITVITGSENYTFSELKSQRIFCHTIHETARKCRTKNNKCMTQTCSVTIWSCRNIFWCSIVVSCMFLCQIAVWKNWKFFFCFFVCLWPLSSVLYYHLSVTNVLTNWV